MVARSGSVDGLVIIRLSKFSFLAVLFLRLLEIK